MDAGGEEGVEGGGGSGGAEGVHLVEGADGVVEHAGAAVGEDEGGEEGLVGDVGVVGFLGFDEGFDIGEAARVEEAFDGEVEGVAEGDWGGGGLGDGREDGEGLVGVAFGSKLGFSRGEGDWRRRRREGGGQKTEMGEKAIPL